MKTSGVESALKEMEYGTTENQFGMEMAYSQPAQFACEPAAEYNEDELVDVLDSKGIGSYVERSKEYDERWHLYLELYGKQYKRINVKIWPGTIRIYPRENEPKLTELAQITSAIEQGMNCELTHDPIDD